MKETKKVVKPPIGLVPKWVRERERLNEVRHAIVRYYDAEIEIPIKWVEEYNELIDIVMHNFIDVNKELPKKNQEVEVLINGNICKCMYYHEKSDISPNGFFGTYYKMVIDNVTHWKNCA